MGSGSYVNPFGGAQQAYGSIPQLPQPQQTQQQAIAGNLTNLGSLYGLGTGVTSNQNVLAASGLKQNLPGYQKMVGQSSQNIESLLKGQVPADVLAQMQQSAAERGIMTGSPGSPNSNAAYLRALGLTSLGLQQQGEGELTGAIQRTPQGQPFNLSSFLTTPEQQQQYGTAQAIYNAAPNPAAAAGANLSAAAAGLAAGGGSIGAPTMPIAAGGYQAPPTNTGSVWGNASNDFQTPDQGYTNWNQWAAGLPGLSSPSGTGFTYMGPDTTNTGTTASAAPAGTSYDPFSDTSSFDPFSQYGGSAFDTTAGAGSAPANTAYDPYSDSSTYDPYSSLGGGAYDTSGASLASADPYAGLTG